MIPFRAAIATLSFFSIQNVSVTLLLLLRLTLLCSPTRPRARGSSPTRRCRVCSGSSSITRTRSTSTTSSWILSAGPRVSYVNHSLYSAAEQRCHTSSAQFYRYFMRPSLWACKHCPPLYYPPLYAVVYRHTYGSKSRFAPWSILE